MHLLSRKPNESHEGCAGGLLAHTTVTDACTVSRPLRPIAYRSALTASNILHGSYLARSGMDRATTHFSGRQAAYSQRRAFTTSPVAADNTRRRAGAWSRIGCPKASA
jgi:hypothetical protein